MKNSTRLERKKYNDDRDDGAYHDKLKSKHNKWEAGDVETDLYLLDLAIQRSRGHDQLREANRIALLDAFAKGRRELIPDVIRFIAFPVGLSIFIGMSLSSSSSTATLKQKVIIWICNFMDLHYLSIILMSNMILLPFVFQTPKVKSKSKSFLQSSPPGSRGMGWMNKKNQNINPSKFLIEIWSSSIFGTICFYIMSFCDTRTRFWPFPFMQRMMMSSGINSSIFDIRLVFIYRLLQLLTRLAAAISIHQYPKVLFEMNQSDQIRPYTKLKALLNPCLQLMMIGLPLGFACDLAQLLHISKMRLARTSGVSSMLFSSLSTSSSSSSSSIYNTLSTPFISVLPTIPHWFYIGASMAFIGPLCHLKAFQRIFQIQYFTNLSLSHNYQTTEALLSNPDTRSKLFKWRWSLKWRRPERVKDTLYKWYQLFVAGYASRDDRRNNQLYDSLADWTNGFSDNKDDDDKNVDSSMNRFSSLVESSEDKIQWKSEILRLEAKRLEKHPNDVKIDRSIWVPNAMNDMAMQHQQDYEDKIFDDYLGVALQQTLGIGFSFDYDHESEEKDSPSIHRLRARAAKSIIARVRQLYNPILAEKKLDGITDLKEREEAGVAIRQNVQKEMERYTQSLIDLLSSNANAPQGTEDLELNLLTESDAIGIREKSEFVAKVGESPMDMDERMTNNDVPSENDFTSMWIDQYYRGRAINETRYDDDDDDDDENEELWLA